MSDDLIKVRYLLADECETIGERGCHEAVQRMEDQP